MNKKNIDEWIKFNAFETSVDYKPFDEDLKYKKIF
jgi:hypothetical protein